MSLPTENIETTHHSASRHVDPVHAVCFALIGAFMTVVSITTTDKIIGNGAYSVENTISHNNRPTPRP